MTDREMWDDAVRIAAIEYEALSESLKRRVGEIAVSIQGCKQEISSLAGRFSLICAACGGLCCKTGKYHFSAIDLLVFFSTGKELFEPVFRETPCPFLGEKRCLMEPPYRPFTCIIFHCESFESRLSPSHLERVYVLEQNLRTLYGRMEELFGNRLRQGLLLRYERRLQGGDSAIFSWGNSLWEG